MVSKRAVIALIAVLFHSVAVASPECDVLRQDLNQAVTDGIGDGYLCVSYTERFGGNGTHNACTDYIGAMMELTTTVQELDERGCYYRIAPGDAKQIARIYTRYVKVVR